MKNIVNVTLFIALSLPSCRAQTVSGTYRNSIELGSKKDVFLKTTLILREDSSYSYKIENDISLVAVNDGTWKVRNGVVYFKSFKGPVESDVKVVGIEKLTLDSLVNSGKRALRFYMIAEDTSTTPGAFVSTSSTEWTIEDANKPLLISAAIEDIDFKYLGKTVSIKIPADQRFNYVTYFIDFSGLQNVSMLSALPFDQLEFKMGRLIKGGKILFEKVQP